MLIHVLSAPLGRR